MSWALPAGTNVFGRTMYGAELVVGGLIALLTGELAVAWFANPAHVLALGMLLVARRAGRSGRSPRLLRTAGVLSACAVVAGGSAVVGASEMPGLGYWVWLAALVAGLVGVVASLPARASDSGAP